MKNSLLTKKIVQTQTEQNFHAQITQKGNHGLVYLKRNIIYYILAVIGVTAFFAHETITQSDWRVTEQGKIWQEAKNDAILALENLKKSTEGTPLYVTYSEKASIRDAEYEKLMKQIAESEFLGFEDFQQWMGEFGWAFALFIYSLSNLVLVFIRKPKTFFAESLWHTSHITVAIFFLRWSFYNKVDFMLPEYFAYNLLTIALVVISTHLFVKYKVKAYNKLQNALHAISRFAIITVRKHLKNDKSTFKEYQKDMFNALKDGMS